MFVDAGVNTTLPITLRSLSSSPLNVTVNVTAPPFSTSDAIFTLAAKGEWAPVPLAAAG